MIDTKKINRVKGILSARLGAEVPTAQPQNFTPPKFQKRKGDAVIYSNDNVNWFQTIDLSQPYVGSTDGFVSIGTVPGLTPTSPWSAVETAAAVSEKQADITIETQAAAQAAAQTAAQAVGSATGTETLSLNGQPQPDETGGRGRNRNPKPVDPEREAKREERREKWANAAGVGVTAALQGIGTAVGAAQKATDSDTTKTIDTAYGAAAEGIKQAGPVGQAIGTAMQMGQVAGDIIQSLGGGTDQQTTVDRWMDSALFSWNIGMLNGFAGKNTQDFGIDQSIMSQVGSSYGDSVNAISEAADKAGKKYGLFSQKARKKADAAINLARSQQNAMGNIADTAATQRLAVQSMGEQAGLAYSMMTSGGYDQRYTYAAKQGGSLEWNPVITLDWEPTVEWEPQVELNWELAVFKEGGTIDINEELEWIPEFQSGNKIRTIEELVAYAKQKNPRFIQRLSEEPRGIKFTDDSGNEAEGSHYLESRGEYVIPRIQEIDGELKFLSPQESIDRAMESGNYLKMTPEEAILFAKQYKQGWPDFFKKFKEGGSLGDYDIPEIEETTQKNVIPEGALHKNKHHMEHAEGLTKKGIPVIDDDGEQQAEIEHSEIIFTLEVTKKLEEYYKIFYSDEATNKEKEQAALDAGKLLVYQILENTEDRTGLIDSCKKGGTLTLKKTTDDLIEEALEDVSAVVIVEEKEITKTPKKKEEKSDKELMKEAIKEVLIELLTK